MLTARVFALFWALIMPAWLQAAGAPRPVAVLYIDGVIGPATAAYFQRGLSWAEREDAQLVVLEMDTPGGLEASMHEINKSILASPLPVAAYVFPKGARAASAGTYILYASHVAAMAPATNLGAATPIEIGGEPGAPGPSKPEGGRDTLAEKQVNDAAAYIRSLAQLRGRNIAWAEKAVREAASLSANEALSQKVIDLMAVNLPDLLAKLDGRHITVGGREVVLETTGAPIIRLRPDWRERALATITNPSIAYMLLLLGFYGLLFEFFNPGFVFPGVAGAISLLLALYALQFLPVNYVGLGLIVLGIGFMIGEIFMPSFGALGVGGLAAFVIGSVMLVGSGAPGYGIPWPLILSVALASALFLIVVVGMALKARSRSVVTGREQLVGSQGEALEDFEQEGWARVHGENWRVRSKTPVKRGQRLRVLNIEGLLLDVEPESPSEQNRRASWNSAS